MDNDKFRSLHDGKCGKPNAINLLFGDWFIEPILLIFGDRLCHWVSHIMIYFRGRCMYIYMCVYHVIWIKKQRSLDNLWNTNEDKKQLKW